VEVYFECKSKVDCSECMNKERSLFAEISEQDRVKINNSKVHCEYKKGEIIFKEGAIPTCLICLNEGKVKLYKEGIGGKEQIIRLAKPIELIGYRALFANEHYRASAIALEKSTVCLIDKNVVLDVIKSNPIIAIKIIKRLAIELGEAKTRLVNLTQKHVRGRLAEALLLLDQRYGINQDSGFLDINIGRHDIADLSNMTTSNASRTLSQFIEEGLIVTKGKSIKILDIDRLKKISNMG